MYHKTRVFSCLFFFEILQLCIRWQQNSCNESFFYFLLSQNPMFILPWLEQLNINTLCVGDFLFHDLWQDDTLKDKVLFTCELFRLFVIFFISCNVCLLSKARWKNFQWFIQSESIQNCKKGFWFRKKNVIFLFPFLTKNI